jgi:AraC-like DNA-binding protein
VAIGIAALIMLYRLAESAGVERGMAVLGDLLTLASSAVLVLAVVEPLRGWSTAPASERQLRIAFVVVYGTCLTVGTVSGAWAGVDPGWAPVHRLVVLCCTIAIVLVTHGALMLRRRRPWTTPIAAATDAAAPDTASPRAGPTTEDLAVASAIRRVLEQRALYREPELKVASVAAAVGSAEHKVSRAITHGLGERNFNQWVNRYRIDHACRLLASGDARSVLEIALDSGFASLGPFNRAFKALTGTTPTAWRAARRRADAAGIDAAGCRVS